MAIPGGGFKPSLVLDKSSFLVGIERIAVQYDRNAKRAITLGTILFVREVKKELSKPGTGRARKIKGKRGIRGGTTKTGRARIRLVSGKNRASAPGEPPAVDFGRLRASINRLVEREFAVWVGEVGTDLDYGFWLEFGTTEMAARPFLQTTLERIRPQLLELFAITLAKTATSIVIG